MLAISDCRFQILDCVAEIVNQALNLKSKIFNLKYPYILVSGSGSAVPGT
jgi:hypothetical protein